MSAPIPAEPVRRRTPSVRIPPGLRRRMRALRRVAPPLAARAATAPLPHAAAARPWDREREILARAHARRRSLSRRDAGPIPVWIWGEGPPVLLVHGWGSRGATARLLRRAARARPDTPSSPSTRPGHGAARERLLLAAAVPLRDRGGGAASTDRSPGSSRTRWAEPRRRSRWRAASTRARVVFLVAPSRDPAGYTRYFADARSGLRERVRRRMERRIVRRFGMSVVRVRRPRPRAKTARRSPARLPRRAGRRGAVVRTARRSRARGREPRS